MAKEAKVLDRKDAAQYLGVGTFHVGELIRKGKFPNAAKQPIEGRKTVKWFIPISELDAYKATRQAGVGKRADGRTKFTIYLDPQEFVLANRTLKEVLGKEWADARPYLLIRANPPKATEAVQS